ncbi:MAG: hypothetical protein SPE89_01845 [Fusicatenibacter saccharivorans]|nr:hypothetical protein [Fusicatenibacter saccharivorans]
MKLARQFRDFEILTEMSIHVCKDIGYELVSYTSEPYEKKGFFYFGR